MTSRTPRRPGLLPIDSPVGRSSDPAHIHAWIDELERMREAHHRSPTVVAAIDEALARAVAWLHDKDSLSGRNLP